MKGYPSISFDAKLKRPCNPKDKDSLTGNHRNIKYLSSNANRRLQDIYITFWKCNPKTLFNKIFWASRLLPFNFHNISVSCSFTASLKYK